MSIVQVLGIKWLWLLWPVRPMGPVTRPAVSIWQYPLFLCIKYVILTSYYHPSSIICIPPKSCAPHHSDKQHMVHSSDSDDDAHHPKKETKREDNMCNQLDETKDFSIANSFVSFTRMFWYLGSLIY